jgi:hypothetical protein
MERALVLSIQFLAQMGPTSAAQPDFLQPATFLDNLVSWYATLPYLLQDSKSM